jgi:hypothetical protein
MVKNKDKTGKSFEKLTEHVFNLLSESESYTKVTRDELLDSPDGPRQFDVVIRSKASSINIVTVVECRDYKGRLDVTHVDGLLGKLDGVSASHAVLVSRKGFTGGALKKAKRVGITLCTIHDFSNIKDIGFQIPILIKDIHGTDFEFSANVEITKEGSSLNRESILKVNDISLGEIFRNELLNGKIESKPSQDYKIWVPEFEDEPPYIREVRTQEKINIHNLKVRYRIQMSYYFGHLSDLPNSIGLHNISQKEKNVFLKAEDLINYKHLFARFEKLEDLPPYDSIPIQAMSIKDIALKHGPIEFRHLDTGKSYFF